MFDEDTGCFNLEEIGHRLELCPGRPVSGERQIDVTLTSRSLRASVSFHELPHSHADFDELANLFADLAQNWRGARPVECGRLRRQAVRSVTADRARR